ncbi:MAG TPA: transglycosylase domain-containing protein [Burkholderiales bacterium]|nr:transglycosylase domain-containing protein [Burkholderiales bacterium]
MYPVARLAAFALLSGSLLWQTAFAADLPSFQQVRAAHRSSYAELLDRHGKVLQMRQIDFSEQRLGWVALSDLSPAMQNALLVSEDRRFFQHHGVDWRAFVGAAWENLRYDTHRGASTLTMQLAGLLDKKLIRRAGGRTYTQKWRQIREADALEKHWTKAQILDTYLNLVTFRSNLSGINAASRALFNVAPAEIDSAQASILAALLRGPNAKPAVVAARACGVARHLKPPRPSCSIITDLAYSKLAPHPEVPSGPGLAQTLAERYLSIPGEYLSTSLNFNIQKLALDSLQKQLELSPKIDGGAIVILKNSTAEILAYANARNDNATAPDPITVQRLAGTLAQAFLYELAIEQYKITAASVLNDTPLPISVPNPFPGYTNDASTPHWVSARFALGAGLALPAGQVLEKISRDDFIDRLQALDMNVPDPAMPLRINASLLDLANAYQTLANRGVYRMAGLRTGGLSAGRTILSADASAIVSNILADPSAHGDSAIPAVYGYASYASEQDDNQQWCIGSTGSVTVAVWMGNGERKNTDTTNNHAAMVWRTVVNALNRGLYPSPAPKLPDDIVVQEIGYKPPIEPAREELFLPGTNLAYPRSLSVESLSGNPP